MRDLSTVCISSGDTGPLRVSRRLDSSKLTVVTEVPVAVASIDSRQAKTQLENEDGACEAKNTAEDSRDPMLLS